MAHRAGVLQVMLHIPVPLRHGDLELVRVDADHVLKREVRVARQPIHDVALARAHGPAREHHPRVLLGHGVGQQA
eukprot:CAMPEP_0198565532 /NCGR_PEP_ID=MMETSP1462-20131121/101922_1 /TAXON_ID=1333877 /ORGANISM="Brandtodinium nutriculum, Strain RCC3387" /LENGTH=74 /DNA_ID=CAMNT_0044296527 /DNA_START=74 /DNA_END=294 /DNA_ORIENTATION=+